MLDFSQNKSGFDEREDYQSLLDKLNELINKMPEKRKQVFVKKKLEEKSIKGNCAGIGNYSQNSGIPHYRSHEIPEKGVRQIADQRHDFFLFVSEEDFKYSNLSL